MLEFDFSNFDYSAVTARSILRASTIIAEYELHPEQRSGYSRVITTSLSSVNVKKEVDITKLLDLFTVLFLDLPAKTWGITLDTGKQIVIGINNRLDTKEFRYVAAHELGHIIMWHPDQLNKCKEDRRGYSLQEIEATTIAAYLLVPVEALAPLSIIRSNTTNKQQLPSKRMSRVVNELAEQLAVPAELVRLRWGLYLHTGF